MYEVANFKNIYYLQTDAFEIIRQRRMDVSAADLRGFQLKPFALAESIFNEVMLVDADVLFFERPEILWSNASYQATGTMVSDSSALSHIADLHTYIIHKMHVCIPVRMLNMYMYVLYYITHVGIQNTLLHTHTHTHTHSLTDSQTPCPVLLRLHHSVARARRPSPRPHQETSLHLPGRHHRQWRLWLGKQPASPLLFVLFKDVLSPNFRRF